MKNVAVIFDCLYGGGAERIAGLLSTKLSEIYNVFLFLEKTDNIVYKYSGTIVDCGSDGTQYMEYNVLISKKKYNIHYSISFMEFFNYINIKTKQQDKVIISERCNLVRALPKSCYDTIMVNRLYKHADHIVSISNGVRDDLISCFGIDKEKITTIYNFIDKKEIIDKSKQTEPDFIKNKSCKLIVSIGRLEDQKDQKRLIYQFKKLFDEDNKYQLVIIGSGNNYASLMEMIEHLNLSSAITIKHYTKNPFTILKQADVFVLASKYEGLGNVILEAMCLGIPVVSTNCPSGPAELLSDSSEYSNAIIDSWVKCERGILVSLFEDKQTSHLADAIKYLFYDVEYRMQIIQNQKKFMETYSESNLLIKWLNVIALTEKSNERLWNERQLKNVIYGAGYYCRVLIEEMVERNREIYAIMVSENEHHPKEILGIPVYKVSRLAEHKDSINVILGVFDFKIIEEMCIELEKYGFVNVERPMMYPKVLGDGV